MENFIKTHKSNLIWSGACALISFIFYMMIDKGTANWLAFGPLSVIFGLLSVNCLFGKEIF